MITLLVALIILVTVIWGVRTVMPLLGLPQPIQTVIYVVIVVIAVVWFVRFIPRAFPNF